MKFQRITGFIFCQALVLYFGRVSSSSTESGLDGSVECQDACKRKCDTPLSLACHSSPVIIIPDGSLIYFTYFINCFVFFKQLNTKCHKDLAKGKGKKSVSCDICIGHECLKIKLNEENSVSHGKLREFLTSMEPNVQWNIDVATSAADVPVGNGGYRFAATLPPNGTPPRRWG